MILLVSPCWADPPVVTLLAPNGGEIWAGGSTQTISWQTSGGGYKNIQLTLLRDGEPYDQIALLYQTSDTSYTWTVCPQAGDDATYAVRVEIPGYDPPVVDESDAVFSIAGAPRPTLALTAPMGGEVWPAGTQQQITWTSANPAGFVQIWLSRGSASPVLLGYMPMAAGVFDWKIDPRTVDASDYALRLVWASSCGPLLSTESGLLQINGGLPLPTATLTSPNGGEALVTDTTVPITWTATDPSGEVEVWLRTDASTNGTYFEYLGSADMASGAFSWLIAPGIPTASNYQIELRTNRAGSTVLDYSEGLFAIAGYFRPVLDITSPAPGASWPAGSTQQVSWTCTASTGEVELNLLQNGRFYAHIGRAPAAAGVLAWTICPGFSAGSYTVEASYLGAAIFKASGTFQITGSNAPVLTITSPAAGASWPAGSVQTISWTSANLTGDVEVYVPDNLRHHYGRVSVPVEAGAYAWSIPSTLAPGSAYTVRVVSTECGSTLLRRSAAFSIAPGSAPFGDVDGSGALDLRDFAAFQTAFTDGGPRRLFMPGLFFDSEPDGDVDGDDFAMLMSGFAAP